MFRKTLGLLNLGVWLMTFSAMLMASFTSIPSNEPLDLNIFFVIASVISLFFMATSATNTIPLLATKDFSLSWPALACLGVSLSIFFLLAGLRIDPGTSGLLYRADLMDLFGLGLVLGAAIDLVDLIAVTVIKKRGNDAKR